MVNLFVGASYKSILSISKIADTARIKSKFPISPNLNNRGIQPYIEYVYTRVCVCVLWPMYMVPVFHLGNSNLESGPNHTQSTHHVDHL